jgi:hypothetical protein
MDPRLAGIDRRLRDVRIGRTALAAALRLVRDRLVRGSFCGLGTSG